MANEKLTYLEGFHTILAGITRHGKSYFAKKELIPILVSFKPVIVFDRKEEYAGRHATDNDKDWLGFSGIDDFMQYLDEVGYLEKQVYVIGCRENKDYIKGLRFFRALKAPVSIILDEAHDLFLDPDFFEAKKDLIKLVRYGAGDGIDVVMITQRYKDLPPNIRSQFTGVITFRQKHSGDIKALDKDGFLDMGDFPSEIQNLRKKQFRVFGDFPEHIEQEIKNKKVA